MCTISESIDYFLETKVTIDDVYNKHYDNLMSNLYNRFSIEPFEKLLTAKNDGVVKDGLYILSEIGNRGFQATDLALNHIHHPDWPARAYLTSHLLSCNKYLTAQQISFALPLLGDEHDVVRSNMMDILSHLPLEKYTEAVINLSDDEAYEFYHAGKEILFCEEFSMEKFIKLYLNSDDILKLYAGARLEKSWRDGEIDEPLLMESSDPEIAHLKFIYKRIHKRKMRKRKA